MPREFSFIEVHGLVKRFGRNTALNHLDLAARGKISGLAGPNGAGKTTLINVLMGLLRPDEGTANILGFDSWTESMEVRRRVGVMLEGSAFPRGLTAYRFVEYMCRLRSLRETSSETHRLLKDVSLDWAEDRNVEGFSSGMLQRLNMAQALAGSPEFIIMDEPTSTLDPLGRHQFLERVQRLVTDRGIRVLISSHVLPELEKICDWILIIMHGKVIRQGYADALYSGGNAAKGYRIVVDEPKKLADLLLSDAHLGLANVRCNQEQHVLTLDTANEEAFVEELNRILRQGQFKLSEMTPTRKTLEEVFMAAVQEQEKKGERARRG